MKKSEYEITAFRQIFNQFFKGKKLHTSTRCDEDNFVMVLSVTDKIRIEFVANEDEKGHTYFTAERLILGD